MIYEITLTESQNLALSYVAVDPHEWIKNAAEARSIAATDEIIQIALGKSIEEGVSLPTSKDEIVSLAFNKGWIKSAADREAEIISNLTNTI